MDDIRKESKNSEQPLHGLKKRSDSTCISMVSAHCVCCGKNGLSGEQDSRKVRSLVNVIAKREFWPRHAY